MLQKIKNPKFIKISTIIMVALILAYSFMENKGETVENINIPVAVGNDIDEQSGKEYVVTLLVAGKSEDELGVVQIGRAKNIGDTRENRSKKMDKRFILGLERIYLIGEEQARSGITQMLDILMRNPTLNDRGYVAVCAGKSYDILKKKEIKGSNIAEYIERLIKNLNEGYFYSKQFTIMDMLMRVDSEGRNLVLPYIELKEDSIENTGLALFKGENMIGVADLNETKYINLMKFSGGKGMLTIQENEDEYVNFYAKSKKKVKCFKENGKYNFTINIDLNGTIVSNLLYKDFNKNTIEFEKFKVTMEKEVKERCEQVVEKINKEYKTDVLALGKYAAAKYGRDTGQDWNTIVPKSNIKVNVKVNVESQGRGEH